MLLIFSTFADFYLTNNITWDVLLEHSKFSTACLLEHFWTIPVGSRHPSRNLFRVNYKDTRTTSLMSYSNIALYLSKCRLIYCFAFAGNGKIPGKLVRVAYRAFWMVSAVLSINGKITQKDHYMKIVRIRSFSGPHFPAYGLITDQKNSE